MSSSNNLAHAPLADRMRPHTIGQFSGQLHLLGEGKPLREAIVSGALHSMIFWGPPGTGKTTLARLIAQTCEANFATLSAVMSGVKDIRACVEKAKLEQQAGGPRTLLFVDEVHRFNKAQQDAFLPYVEDGTIVFIGATTENPSFEVNNALLSRTRVYRLKPLQSQELVGVIKRALTDSEFGLGNLEISIDDELIELIANAGDGDARRALTLLEIAVDIAPESDNGRVLTRQILNEVLQGQVARFDKKGDQFYEQISALHKAVRGSSPDAALYWLARMLEGGCDPLYIARRVVRMASEDIGNADPRALRISLDCWDVIQRLGSPEGELSLAQAVVYLACAAKSASVYQAFNAVRADIRKLPNFDVPMHLRNAPTGLMKDEGYSQDYRYAHDHPEGYIAGENYLPEQISQNRYYQPVERGLEKQIKQRLDYFQSLDDNSAFQRYDGSKSS